MTKLEDKGIRDNTLIIFTSDHGEVRAYNAVRRDKLRLFEVFSHKLSYISACFFRCLGPMECGINSHSLKKL